MALKPIQRGKAVSFILAIAGCRLYLREIVKAISRVILKMATKVIFSDLSWNIDDSWMTGQVACLGGRKNTLLSLYIATLPKELGETFCCRIVAELKHGIIGEKSRAT